MKIILLFFFCLTNIQVQAAEKVEFVANNIHSLIVFIDAIAGSPRQPVQLKKTFEKSSFNNSASTKMIELYQDLGPVFERFIEFKDMAPDRNNGVSVRSLVWIQSAFASDMDDFQERIMSMMQFSEMAKFRKVLEYFAPIHDSLLWKPYHKELQKKAAFFEQKSKEWKLDEMFSKAKVFYNSQWPDSQKFRISLFPIPPEAKASAASSYGPFESVGIIIGEKDEVGRFAVIFHELCHSLYAAQGMDFQKQMSKWFMDSESPYGKMTQRWVNEVLATIVGNGWAYYKMKGELDKSEWYHDSIIEELSRSLYPEAAKYLDSGKPLDAKLMSRLIEIFQKKFPESIKEFEPLLANLILVTDGSMGSSRPFSQQLLQFFKIRSMNSSSPINHGETLKTIKDNNFSTVFIVANWKNTKQFDSLKIDYPAIANMMNRAGQSGNILGIFDIDGRKFIISILQEEHGYDFLAGKLKSLKKIEKLNEFLDLDTI